VRVYISVDMEGIAGVVTVAGAITYRRRDLRI